jgi:hypothetical protein
MVMMLGGVMHIAYSSFNLLTLNLCVDEVGRRDICYKSLITIHAKEDPPGEELVDVFVSMPNN